VQVNVPVIEELREDGRVRQDLLEIMEADMSKNIEKYNMNREIPCYVM